jgi:hypothetical protein
MAVETSASISVHLGDAARFEVRQYPACPAGPSASIEVGGGVGLLAFDPDRFRRLAVLATEAADWLAGIRAADASPGESAPLSVVTS